MDNRGYVNAFNFKDVFVPEKFKAEDIKEDIDLVAEVSF